MSLAGEWNGSTVTYNFAAYPNGHHFTAGSSVTNSSGNQVTIMNDSYNQLENRFATSASLAENDNKAWYIREYGNYDGLYTSAGGGTRILSILNLHANDKVTIYFSGSNGRNISFKTSGQAYGQNADATLTSGTQYTVSATGSLDLNVDKDLTISSIVIYQDPSTWTVYFDKTNCDAELIDMNFQEPNLICPQGSYVQYQVSNPSLATLGGEQGSGDLTLLNTGKCTIYANVWYNNTYYQASYNLTIKADDATYEIVDDTYTLTGPGKLTERVVNGVPKIQMEFGENADDVVNTTMVRNLSGIQDPVATTIDVNGWRHIWATFDNYRVLPHQGTFYTFKPKASGELTVRGYLNTGNAYIVDSENLAPMPFELTSRVGIAQNNWSGSSGMVGTAAPQVTTYDGRTTPMAERFETNNGGTGVMIQQTITGLADGTYEVKLYANAYYTPYNWVSNNNVTFNNGDNTFAYVFANNVQQAIPAYNNTQISTSGEYTIEAEVTNGNLTIGIGKYKIGTNWHTIQIKQLTLKNAASIQFTPVATITTSSATQKLETTVDVIGGHTYYLYGNTPNTLSYNDWACYQLSSFTFTPNFRYEQKSIVLERGATAGGQSLSGNVSGDVRYTAEGKGNISNVVLDNNGWVTSFEGDGGAIIVTAKKYYNGAVTDEDYYVITVPYTNHMWDFYTTYPSFSALDQNLDWGVNYEVRQYDEETRALYYLNEPIFTTQQALEGNNAYWIGETAGLVVDASGKSFGLRAETDNLGDVDNYNAKYGTSYTAEEFAELKEDGAFVDVYLKDMLNYKKADVHGTNIPAMDKNAVLTIPRLKAGTYVGIKTYRHSPNTGDFIHVTNVTDLDGNTYDGTNNMDLMVLNQSGVGEDGLLARRYGWIVFKAAADGDVTFQVTDKGWTHIKKVMISESFYDIDEFYEDEPDATAFDSDMILAKQGAETLTAYSAIDDLKSPTVFDYDGTSMSYTFGNNANGCVTMNETWHHVKYSIEDIKGFGDYSYESQGNNSNSGAFANRANRASEPTISISEDGVLSVTGGHGSVVVVQRVLARNDDHWTFTDDVADYTGNYVVDINRTRIYIREPGDTHQDYPYTWDFTNIPNFEESDYWKDNEDGTFSPTDEAKNSFIQNNELEIADGNDVDELDELGFLTSTDEHGVTADGLDNVSIKTGGDGDNGLVIGSEEETTIVVPDVPEGATVYIRLTPNGDGDDNTETVIKGGTGDAQADGYTPTLDEDDMITNTDVDGTGQNTYEIPGDGGDVNITVKDVIIEGIAVTNIYKECKFWDTINSHDDGSTLDNHGGQYCYNSDCHELAIKYPLTQYYTNIFMEAVYVTGTTRDENKVFASVQDIDITPSIETLAANGVTLDDSKNEGFGVLVWSTDYDVNHPLFVPAIHDVPDVNTNAGNMLKGVYAATSLPASTDDEYLYVFTNVYNKTDGSASGLVASLPGFYKVNSSGTLKANRAYLPLAAADAPLSNLTTIFITPNSGGLNSIDQIAIDGEIDVNGTFHTISGMTIQGMPSQRGVYIQNGKKVLIK